MQQTVRLNTFETNSSSTHSLVLKNYTDNDYVSISNKIIVEFIDTDDCGRLHSLKEKVSYLVSHIINNYKYDVYDYSDLKEQVENDYNFIRIKDFVKEHFNKDVVLPPILNNQHNEEYGEVPIEEIVSINHQLVNDTFDDLLQDIVYANSEDLLAKILNPNTAIEIGHD